MAGAKEFDREGLVERLLGFDEEVGVRFPEMNYELLLVGGGALILLGVVDRPTTDLDAVSFPIGLTELMRRYDISTRATSHESRIPYNRDDRRVRLDIPTEHGICYAASLEDLVASKLCSSRDQDAEDVRNAGVLAELDWSRLAEIALEMPLNCMNKRELGEFDHNYHSYLEEFGPCAG
jgi:hypothetical protein